MQRTVYVRASNDEVFRRLRNLEGIVTGRKGGGGSWQQILLVRMGLALLAKIKEAFLVKARGGTDETGLRWKPLSPYTIAYSRRHRAFSKTKPGVLTKSWVPRPGVRARYRPSWILTKKQRERWWDLYRRYLAIYHGDKAHAARIAWSILKDEGAQTLMGVYGNTPVEILRDTGVLYNSLSPGMVVGTAPPPQHPPKPDKQVFRTRLGEVIVGTNRKWSWTHHEGTARIPRRPLWPDPKRWTGGWWDAILTQGQLGIVDLIVYLLRK